MSESKLLSRIIQKQNRIANVQVVFVDVEKYSKRRTAAQITVVDAFTECLNKALKYVSQHYVSYAQQNDVNFHTDIIKLPTGDGAAIVFPFDGLHDIHLVFALNLLKEVYSHNLNNQCEKFSSSGWCNCHSNFHLTVGLSEGKAVVYNDINGNYNIAGGVINYAARVMSKADRSQILFTEDAFKQIVEMDSDANLVDKFKKFEVEIKHKRNNTSLSVCGSTRLPSTQLPPKTLTYITAQKLAMRKMELGLPIPDDSIDSKEAIKVMETFADAYTLFKRKACRFDDRKRGRLERCHRAVAF